MSLSPTVLPEARWMLAAEHTKTRSGGKEKKEEAKRKKESAKK
ncbi:hypothetical protein [Myxococcus xanthus]|nr:hypothetical protein [Myxococcus xanthus]